MPAKADFRRYRLRLSIFRRAFFFSQTPADYRSAHEQAIDRLIPGHPQRLNSLPMSMAVSPDGRYVVTVNAGYGTFESKYEQSLAVLDTQTGALADFPDARTLDARQADALLRPRLQPRRQPHVRQHGLADRPARRKRRTTRAAALWSTALQRERLRRSGSFTCRCSSLRRDARRG